MIKQYINTKKLENFAKKIPLSPNTITFLSLLCAVFALFFNNYFSFVLFSIAIFLDAIDGLVARAKNQKSNLGAFLDGITDRAVEFLIIIWFLMRFPGSWPVLITLLFFGTCMVSFAKAYAYYRKILNEKEVTKLVTLLGREERTFLMILALLLIHLNFGNYANMIIYAITFLSLVSFLYLIMQILKTKNQKA